MAFNEVKESREAGHMSLIFQTLQEHISWSLFLIFTFFMYFLLITLACWQETTENRKLPRKFIFLYVRIPVTPEMVLVVPNCPEQPHLKSPPRHPPSHGPGVLFWLSHEHLALTLSHTVSSGLLFTLSVHGPRSWSLALASVLRPCGMVLTGEGSVWGLLSCWLSPYLYFCSLTSSLTRVTLGLILSSLFVALCVDPLFRSFFHQWCWL